MCRIGFCFCLVFSDLLSNFGPVDICATCPILTQHGGQHLANLLNNHQTKHNPSATMSGKLCLCFCWFFCFLLLWSSGSGEQHLPHDEEQFGQNLENQPQKHRTNTNNQKSSYPHCHHGRKVWLWFFVVLWVYWKILRNIAQTHSTCWPTFGKPTNNRTKGKTILPRPWLKRSCFFLRCFWLFGFWGFCFFGFLVQENVAQDFPNVAQHFTQHLTNQPTHPKNGL